MSEPIKCPNCDATISEDESVCPYCNKFLKSPSPTWKIRPQLNGAPLPPIKPTPPNKSNILAERLASTPKPPPENSPYLQKRQEDSVTGLLLLCLTVSILVLLVVVFWLSYR